MERYAFVRLSLGIGLMLISSDVSFLVMESVCCRRTLNPMVSLILSKVFNCDVWMSILMPSNFWKVHAFAGSLSMFPSLVK